ncbi:MAG: hypothetical protein JSS07_01800 [Proteobacteria bacterium]|nr:hypothetical protein [Pseudomonadota bacterium]
MSLFNLTKYSPLCLWLLAMRSLLTFRTLFFNFTKIFVLVCAFLASHFWHVAQANTVVELPWIIDEYHLISTAAMKGVTDVLAQSAQSGHAHIRVLVLNVQSENLKEIINQKVMESQNRLPFALKEKTTFFVINLGTNQSVVLLAKALAKTDPLNQSLKRIQQKIVLPLLENGEIEQALAQGVVALTTVLETESLTDSSSFWHRLSVWLSDHYLLLLIQILVLVSLFFGAWKLYFTQSRTHAWKKMT